MTEKDFDALWTNLVKRSHGKDGPPLSEHERHFYAVNLLKGSVPRSGFIGYFENWSGSAIADAYEGLKALRLQRVLVLLERAQKTVLGDHPLPKGPSSIGIFSDSLTEQEYEIESDRIDQALAPVETEFFNYEDEIWSALCDYADTHQLKPKG